MSLSSWNTPPQLLGDGIRGFPLNENKVKMTGLSPPERCLFSTLKVLIFYCPGKGKEGGEGGWGRQGLNVALSDCVPTGTTIWFKLIPFTSYTVIDYLKGKHILHIYHCAFYMPTLLGYKAVLSFYEHKVLQY